MEAGNEGGDVVKRIVWPSVWGGIVWRGSGCRLACWWLEGSVFAKRRHRRVLSVVVGVLVLVARHDVEGNLIVASPLESGVLESEVL